MLVPTLFLLSLGLIAAIGLSIASKVFYVWEDPKILDVEDALLGANCGGCGFPGCSAAAASVVAGTSEADVCVAGGPEITQNVATIMGVKIEIKEPEISTLSCRYGTEEADTKFHYVGVSDCRAAILFGGGIKECPIGCLGLGTCVRACPFGALKMGDEGLPVVIREKCRSCGICEEICPKNIIKLSSSTNRMIADYTIDECTTPCQRACPTGIDIPGYIREISKGNYDEALRIIKEKNPLPLIVGRICPAPCEFECRRNISDDPVGINNLKRFVADLAMKNGKAINPYKLPDNEMKVAVIGGGAQGLTTSYYLSCLGFQPTIFEAADKLGGIVRKIIPQSRLPENIIDQDINNILDNGVNAEINKALGRDFTINSLLKDGNEAVVLASGGLDSRKVLRGNVDLEQNIPGIYTLLDFYANKDSADIKIGKDVYIIGLGNSTLEAARICMQKGAGTITILYPYSDEDIEKRGINIENIESEGIKILYSTIATRLLGEGDQLKEIVIQNADGSIEKSAADTIIVSTGRLSDLVFVRPRDEETREAITDTDSWETVEAIKVFPGITTPDIFNIAENAVINDNMAVVKAIGRGRRIARAVSLYLKDNELTPQDNAITPEMNILDVDILVNVQENRREPMPMSQLNAHENEITEKFYLSETNLGYTEEIAKKEADRCLDCGLICYKKSIS